MIIKKTKQDLLPGADFTNPNIRDFNWSLQESHYLDKPETLIEYNSGSDYFGPMMGSYSGGLMINWTTDWSKLNVED